MFHVAGIEDGTARRTRPPVNHVAAAAVADHGTNNFATIRTTSIVTKQQKEHMQVLKKCDEHYKRIGFCNFSNLIFLQLT